MVRQEATPIRAEAGCELDGEANGVCRPGRAPVAGGAGGAGQGSARGGAACVACRLGAGAGRPDPIELLEQQAATRVPELVPIRYGRMLVSPFTFFRGGALIMASDLAATPRSGLQVQLCGDAHLSNFGVFGTPERNLVFSINDFDETHPGPWEWDLKRLTASLAVAGRDRDFSAAQRREIVLAAAEEYRTAMREFAGKSNLDMWYARMDIEAKIAELRGQLDEAADRGVRGGHREGADEGSTAVVLQAHRGGRRQVPDHQ